jgi:hypothetical protein
MPDHIACCSFESDIEFAVRTIAKMGSNDVTFLGGEALAVHQRRSAVLDLLTVHGSGKINVLTTDHQVTTELSRFGQKESADRGLRRAKLTRQTNRRVLNKGLSSQSILHKVRNRNRIIQHLPKLTQSDS